MKQIKEICGFLARQRCFPFSSVMWRNGEAIRSATVQTEWTFKLVKETWGATTARMCLMESLVPPPSWSHPSSQLAAFPFLEIRRQRLYTGNMATNSERLPISPSPWTWAEPMTALINKICQEWCPVILSLCLSFFLTTLALRLPPLETHLPYWQVAQITWVCIQAFCSAFLAKLVAKNQHQLSAWRVNCLGRSSPIEPQSTSRGAEVQPIQAQSTHRITRKNKPATKYWDGLLCSNR